MAKKVDFKNILACVRHWCIWNKGRVIEGLDPKVWRMDCFGNFIKWDEYGNRNSRFGWEHDHILPVSWNGSDRLDNLRPLQWKSNVLRHVLRQRLLKPQAKTAR